MKRYFLAKVADHAAAILNGEHHWIELASIGKAGSGYRIAVLIEEQIKAPGSWEALPHLLDSKTSVTDAHAALLADAKVAKGDTAYAAGAKLAAIHPRFDP